MFFCLFFFFWFYKVHPSPQKQQRIWKTKYLSVIHCSCYNNSFAALRQYFNTCIAHSERKKGKWWQRQEKCHIIHKISGTAISHIRGHICIDFVTSESGLVLIGRVHLQSTKLIAQSHGNSRQTRPVWYSLCLVLGPPASAALHRIITPGWWQRTGPVLSPMCLWCDNVVTPISSKEASVLVNSWCVKSEKHPC